MSTSSKRAFVTGAFGQDGSYLSEHLLREGYEVLGLVRAGDTNTLDNDSLAGQPKFTVVSGDLTKLATYADAVTTFQPDEIYNLAAVSDLNTAAKNPELTMAVNFTAVKELADFVFSFKPNSKFFQALSSRILSPGPDGRIDERSALAKGTNPYDEAKLASYKEAVLKKRNEGFFIASGFLCNHESPRRGERFVTGRIAKEAVAVVRGAQEKILVGNVEARRDWSFAGDFAVAMNLILQAKEPGDFVIGSGVTHTVREFIDLAFGVLGQKLTWSGEGLEAKATNENGAIVVETSPQFYRTDDNPVFGDPSKLSRETGWAPEVSFGELVTMMVRHEQGFQK